MAIYSSTGSVVCRLTTATSLGRVAQGCGLSNCIAPHNRDITSSYSRARSLVRRIPAFQQGPMRAQMKAEDLKALQSPLKERDRKHVVEGKSGSVRVDFGG